MSKRGVRRAASVLAITVAVAVIGGATAGAIIIRANQGDEGDPVVQAILDSTFTGPCVTSNDAVSGLTQSLRAEGLGQWQVQSRADDGDCVAGGLDSSTATIHLFQVQSPAVTEAMAGVQRDLMSRCLDESAAIGFVSSVLTSAGVADFEIRTDGPFAFPLDQESEVKQHVAEGCYVYSLSGQGEDGTPTYYLSGTG